jgi:acetate kinase
LQLDPLKNASPHLDQDISAERSIVRVFVVRAQEDWAIARECWNVAFAPGVLPMVATRKLQ